jgi:hypothetical protein
VPDHNDVLSKAPEDAVIISMFLEGEGEIELSRLADRVTDPDHPEYGAYIDRFTLRDMVATPKDAVPTIKRWLEEHDLHVIGLVQGKLIIFVGTAEAVAKTFGRRAERWLKDSSTFAPVTWPLPMEIRSLVRSMYGRDQATTRRLRALGPSRDAFWRTMSELEGTAHAGCCMSRPSGGPRPNGQGRGGTRGSGVDLWGPATRRGAPEHRRCSPARRRSARCSRREGTRWRAGCRPKDRTPGPRRSAAVVLLVSPQLGGVMWGGEGCPTAPGAATAARGFAPSEHPGSKSTRSTLRSRGACYDDSSPRDSRKRCRHTRSRARDQQSLTSTTPDASAISSSVPVVLSTMKPNRISNLSSIAVVSASNAS